jgi:3-phenylpropionate/trans-cinnamate dioxygenase ferredoxin reductase component
MALEHVAIVGTGPAGLSAARAFRAAGGRARVTLVGEEEHAPYRRPPLSKEYLRGEMTRAELFIEEAGWFDEQAIELRLGRVVTAIDAEAGRLELAGGERLTADACLLATGANPVRPPIAGADHPGVLLMRRMPDSESLAAHAQQGTTAVVIGSGFIGCEAAASLASLGARVTMVSVEPVPQAERLGHEVGQRIAAWLEQAGVQLQLGTEVAAIEHARHVRLQDGAQLWADYVALVAGVRPRSELATRCGLRLHDGAIEVDAQLRTSTSTIRAAGDVAYAYNAAAERHLRVEHWGDALKQGEVAGRALAGEDVRWDDVPGFWSTIGEHTLKYAAWGDGHDEARLVEHGGGAFTAWYTREGVAVGVLTHDCDEDYERGTELIRAGSRL